MSNKQNTNHGKQNAQDVRNAEGAKANFDKAGDQTAERGKQFADAAREGANKIVDVSEKAAESTKQAMQNGIEIASQEAREAADRFSKTPCFSGQDSERLAEQSKQNLEAITRCSTVLSQAFQDASRSLFDLGQKQFQRNLEGAEQADPGQVSSGVRRRSGALRSTVASEHAADLRLTLSRATSSVMA